MLKLLLTLLLASEQVNAFSLGGVHQTRARALARQAAPLAQDESTPNAYIEFIIGVPEPCVPGYAGTAFPLITQHDEWMSF